MQQICCRIAGPKRASGLSQLEGQLQCVRELETTPDDEGTIGREEASENRSVAVRSDPRVRGSERAAHPFRKLRQLVRPCSVTAKGPRRRGGDECDADELCDIGLGCRNRTFLARGKVSRHVGSECERRGCVVRQSDGERTATARRLHERDHVGARARLAEGDQRAVGRCGLDAVLGDEARRRKGDWNADGKDTVALYDPLGTTFWFEVRLEKQAERPNAVAGELAGARVEAQLVFPGRIKQVLTNLRVGQPVTANEKDVQVVQGDGPDGMVVSLYFDEKTNLLVRMVRYGRSPIGRISVQVDYDDYRDVSGVKIPFKYTYSWLDGRDFVQLNNVRINAPIDAAKFERQGR